MICLHSNSRTCSGARRVSLWTARRQILLGRQEQRKGPARNVGFRELTDHGEERPAAKRFSIWYECEEYVVYNLKAFEAKVAFNLPQWLEHHKGHVGTCEK